MGRTSRGVFFSKKKHSTCSTDCEVDPDNQTITLPASFLNTLALGEHSFEAYFSEPESGSAKATFKIVEEKDIPVPNTGVFTGEDGGVEMMNDFVAIAVIVGAAVVVSFLIRKKKQGIRN